MSDLVVIDKNIPAMSESAIDKVRQLEAALLELPGINIDTHHTIHAGVYARTIMVPAGTVLTGVLIQIPTTLIVSGDALVYVGADVVEIVGYHVFAASAGRRQALTTRKDTWFTMIFASEARTVEEAEEQFTNEAHLLGSRAQNSKNIITITGG